MKLNAIGATRKEVYSSPEVASKDYDNEKVYPELMVEGKLAEQLGAENFEDGEEYEMTVRVKVKRITKTIEDGDSRYAMTLCVTGASDPTKTDGGDDDDGATQESGNYDDDSPLSAIERLAAD